MEFRVEEDIWRDFPGLTIGLVVVRGIDNAGESDEIAQLLTEQVEATKQGNEEKNLLEDPRILAWRQAYSSFRAKPKKHRSSIENLCQTLLGAGELRSISKVVDLYNALSLKYLMPFGGDDLDCVEEFISLTYAKGDERFVALNSTDETHPKAGEVVYVDKDDVLCRRWNWRECDKSKMTESSRNVSLVIEGLPPVAEEQVEAAANELGKLIVQNCGGTLDISILNASCQKVSL